MWLWLIKRHIDESSTCWHVLLFLRRGKSIESSGEPNSSDDSHVLRRLSISARLSVWGNRLFSNLFFQFSLASRLQRDCGMCQSMTSFVWSKGKFIIPSLLHTKFGLFGPCKKLMPIKPKSFLISRWIENSPALFPRVAIIVGTMPARH